MCSIVKKNEYFGTQSVAIASILLKIEAKILMTCYMTSFMETLCDREYKVVHRKTQRVMTLDVEDECPEKVFSYTAKVNDLCDAYFHFWNREQKYKTIKRMNPCFSSENSENIP